MKKFRCTGTYGGSGIVPNGADFVQTMASKNNIVSNILSSSLLLLLLLLLSLFFSKTSL